MFREGGILGLVDEETLVSLVLNTWLRWALEHTI